MAARCPIYEGMCQERELRKGVWEQCAIVPREQVGRNGERWWWEGKENIWNVLNKKTEPNDILSSLRTWNIVVSEKNLLFSYTEIMSLSKDLRPNFLHRQLLYALLAFVWTIRRDDPTFSSLWCGHFRPPWCFVLFSPLLRPGETRHNRGKGSTPRMLYDTLLFLKVDY